MQFIISVLIAAATYLIFKSQVAIDLRRHVRTPLIDPWKFSRRQSLQPQHTFAFLWAIKSELEAGATSEVALAQSLSAVPKNILTATRIALDAQTYPYAALKIDANELKAEEIVQLAEILEITAFTGAPIETSIARLITTVRARQAQTQLIREELASTRTTTYVLATIPLLGLFIGTVAGLAPIPFLMSRPWGWACSVSALLLEGLGIVWVRILVSRVTT